MDLISWSLNAIDQIFSTKRLGKGEPACPDGTFAAGYTMDSWEKWRIVCLSILSVEDVEDVYIIGIMITGILLFGVSSFLIYRKVRKMLAALLAIEKLPVITEGMCRAANTQTQALGELNRKLDELNRKLDAVLDQNRKLDVVVELCRKMDTN